MSNSLPPSPYYQPVHRDSTSVTSTPADAPALPVVIAGAGPVGMAVALGLAQRGIEVVVLEGANQVSFGSRAICISRHSLEVADRLGFGDDIDEISIAWEGGRSFYRDREVLRFQMANEAHAARGPMVNVSQSEFEQVMVEDLEAHPLITLHWGAKVTGVTQVDGDEVVVEVSSEAGDATLRTSWLVASDGGRSAVRDALGLRLQGQSYEGRYVIADIHWQSDLPTERMVWFDPPSNPGSTVIMHRQPNDIWRIDYQLSPEDDADEETQEDRIRERIANHLTWLGDDRPWTLEWHGFYMARALALESFTHGRVLFSGDAAHLVPIFGVRGLNSGMEDAETLTWMLASVINGTADASLLTAYSHERHDAWEQNIANAGKSTLVMTPGTHGFRTTRDALLALSCEHEQFSHLINPRQSSATHARTSPLTLPLATSEAERVALVPGDPVENRRVTLTDGTATSLNELRGSGFAVIGFGLDEAGAAAAVALAEQIAKTLPWEGATLVLSAVTEGAPTPAHAAADDVAVLADTDVANAWAARTGELFVVRPDGLLLARGTELDATAILARLADGGAAAGPAAAVEAPLVAQDPAEAAREAIWLALSHGIDGVDSEGVEGFLARLTLLLGTQLTPEAFAEAVAQASAVN